uniref:protein-serine/threonine phosphatase n=1 Tax=Arcella intermedia TaxID=1963864 RepID=A0A6B2L8U1_9EUKA
MTLYRMGSADFKIGVACMQGFRNEMEDAHIVVLNGVHHPNAGYFGVLDGHRGSTASRWFSENVVPALDRLPQFTSDEIQKTMIQLDIQYLSETNDMNSGTTAIFCILEKLDQPKDDNHFRATIINLGDSKFYIGKVGSPSFSSLTHDHKPTNDVERERIEAAGGCVLRGRVDSFLSVARALGDHQYKTRKDLPPEKQKIIAVPDVSTVLIGPSDYLVLCCDGILEPEHVANGGSGIFNFLHSKLQASEDTAEVLSELIQHLLQNGSKDNMTAMLIELKDGSHYNLGKEFIPGEYYGEFGNSTYVDAYKSSCEREGKTVEQARELWGSRRDLILNRKK